jgi:hypothetical protein
MLNKLPYLLLLQIFAFIKEDKDVCNLALVCRSFFDIFQKKREVLREVLLCSMAIQQKNKIVLTILHQNGYGYIHFLYPIWLIQWMTGRWTSDQYMDQLFKYTRAIKFKQRKMVCFFVSWLDCVSITPSDHTPIPYPSLQYQIVLSGVSGPLSWWLQYDYIPISHRNFTFEVLINMGIIWENAVVNCFLGYTPGYVNYITL